MTLSFWNPELLRERMLEGVIASEHSWTYDTSKPMGNWAVGMVGEVANSALLKLFDRMVDLCPRAIEWIDRSIARAEEFAGDTQLYHQRLIACKAQAQWFQANAEAGDVWSEAFDRLLPFMQRDRAHAKSPWFGLLMNDLMARALQAGRCAVGIQTYHELVGAPPQKLKAVTNPRQLAYMHCQQALDQRHDPSELLAAGRRVLQKNLAEVWLHNGQYLHAATWLKIVYWHADPKLGPERTMLKAYDDMPTVPRPSFL
jgi:hypothetical protein